MKRRESRPGLLDVTHGLYIMLSNDKHPQLSYSFEPKPDHSSRGTWPFITRTLFNRNTSFKASRQTNELGFICPFLPQR